MANEALQHHFNYHIFQAELNLYSSEDIPAPLQFEYIDNQDVLDLISKRPKGILPTLDEEGMVPKGTVEGFLNKIVKQHINHPRFYYKSGKKDFSIKHYAGEVLYSPAFFLFKNKDTLSVDLVDVMSKSSTDLIASFFSSSSEAASAMEDCEGGGGGSSKSNSNKQTVTRRFSVQLDSLIDNLNTTQPQYIRCIKPNMTKDSNVFDSKLADEQLTYSGIFEAVCIIKGGYPFRMTHDEFRSRYHMIILDSIERAKFFGEPNEFRGSTDQAGKSRRQCAYLLSSMMDTGVGAELKSVMVGKSKAFYRSEQHYLLEGVRRKLVDYAMSVRWKSLKGFAVRIITKPIFAALRLCVTAIFSKDIVKLEVAISRDVPTLKQKLKRMSGADIKCEAFEFAQECHGALFNLNLIANRLERVLALVTKKTLTIEETYDDLEGFVSDAKALTVKKLFHGRDVRISWEDEPRIAQAAKTVGDFTLIVSIKRKFDLGVRSNNEILLEAALGELRQLRHSGAIDNAFCVDEEKAAEAAVSCAREVMTAFSATVQGAMRVGRLKPSRSAMTNELAIATAFQSLSAVLKDSESSAVANVRQLHKSRRARQLLHTCRRLRDLRENAGRDAWELIWDELQDWLVALGYKAGPLKSVTAPEKFAPRKKNMKQKTVLVPKKVKKLVQPRLSPPPLPTTLPSPPSSAFPSPPASRMPSIVVSRRASQPDYLPPPLPSKNKTKIVRRPKKVFRLIQLFNKEEIAFFLDMDTGNVTWSLPEGASLSSVIHISHINEEDGTFYYENLRTKDVKWNPPLEEMSDAARELLGPMMALSQAECLDAVGPDYSPEDSMTLLVNLDEFVEKVDKNEIVLSDEVEYDEVEEEVDFEEEEEEDSQAQQEGFGSSHPPFAAEAEDEVRALAQHVSDALQVEEYEVVEEVVEEVVSYYSDDEAVEEEPDDPAFIYIPPEMESDIRAEIRDFCLCVVQFVLMPELDVEAADHGVPDVLHFNGSDLDMNISIDPLTKAIAKVEEQRQVHFKRYLKTLLLLFYFLNIWNFKT